MGQFQDAPKLRQIGTKSKIAFVCSGGGVKAGAFHLGVAIALAEHGFRFQGGRIVDQKQTPPDSLPVSTYVGSSAGGVICAYLAAGYSLENIYYSFSNEGHHRESDTFPRVLPRMTYRNVFKLRGELAKEQVKQALHLKTMLAQIVKGNWESFVEFKWLKTNGFFSTRGIEEFLREEVLLSNQFEDYFADLFIVATQLNHSKKVVFGKMHSRQGDPSCEYVNHVPISEACAASAALPLFFAPYEIDMGNGRPTHFVDGEIRDTLSTHVAEEAGADLIIASYTHQPYHESPEIGSLTRYGLPSIFVQSIYLLIEQKINSAIHFRQSVHNALQAVSEYCSEKGLKEKDRERILQILEAELGKGSTAETIYIHPKANDAEMFMQEHFTFTPEKMTDMVRSGFRAAVDVLKNYRFANRRPENPLSVSAQLG